MRIFVPALVVTLWAILRWLGLAAGLYRVRALDPGVRAQARRSAVTHASISVLVTIVAGYLWVRNLGLRPTDSFSYWIAGAAVVALVAVASSLFMQPAERDPSTYGLFRPLTGSPRRARVHAPPEDA